MSILYELRCDHCNKRIFEKDAVRCIDAAKFIHLSVDDNNVAEDEYEYLGDLLIIAEDCFNDAIAGYFLRYQPTKAEDVAVPRRY